MTNSPNDPSREHLAWHAQRIASLRAEDGWLTLVGLDFLDDGSYTIGSCGSASFSYANCAEPIVGRLDVAGSQVRFTATGASEGVLLVDDGSADATHPASVIRSGPVSFALVRRNGRLALRVRDNQSPVRTGFGGIGLFPYDPAFAVDAQVLPPREGELVAITNVRGFVEQQPVSATLRFELGGVARQLVATAGGGGRLFVVFADETNGTQTYGGGRFIDVPAPVAGRTLVDFNRAYNPPCGFTAFATCPLPPACNQLTVPVPAGERSPHSGESSVVR